MRGIHWSPVNSPQQRPVTRSIDVFFDLRLNKRLSKQSWGWWFETPSLSLWRQCNDDVAVLMEDITENGADYFKTMLTSWLGPDYKVHCHQFIWTNLLFTYLFNNALFQPTQFCNSCNNTSVNTSMYTQASMWVGASKRYLHCIFWSSALVIHVFDIHFSNNNSLIYFAWVNMNIYIYI